jgi:8-oxo-dGTP pyrophosphatase MutT (NUDIX family)
VWIRTCTYLVSVRNNSLAQLQQQQATMNSTQDVYGAGVIVVDKQQRILTVRPHRTPRLGLPKGHREIGELPVQTALRELYEETGLQLQPDQLLAGFEWRFVSFGNLYCFFAAIVDSLPDQVPLAPVDVGEIAACQWCDIQNFLRLSHRDGNHVVRELIKGLNWWLDSDGAGSQMAPDLEKYVPLLLLLPHLVNIGELSSLAGCANPFPAGAGAGTVATVPT